MGDEEIRADIDRLNRRLLANEYRGSLNTFLKIVDRATAYAIPMAGVYLILIMLARYI